MSHFRKGRAIGRLNWKRLQCHSGVLWKKRDSWLKFYSFCSIKNVSLLLQEAFLTFNITSLKHFWEETFLKVLRVVPYKHSSSILSWFGDEGMIIELTALDRPVSSVSCWRILELNRPFGSPAFSPLKTSFWGGLNLNWFRVLAGATGLWIPKLVTDFCCRVTAARWKEAVVTLQQQSALKLHSSSFCGGSVVENFISAKGIGTMSSITLATCKRCLVTWNWNIILYLHNLFPMETCTCNMQVQSILLVLTWATICI